MSECYCDFDQYMAHVQQMEHITSTVTTTILAFVPQWYQGLYSSVKTLLLSVCSQEVITCFTSVSTAITCQPAASQEFSERENTKRKKFPQSSLLMTMLPCPLLEGEESISITHPFFGFWSCVINHVSAPKLLSFISVTCPMDTRKAHTVPYNELCHHL